MANVYLIFLIGNVRRALVWYVSFIFSMVNLVVFRKPRHPDPSAPTSSMGEWRCRSCRVCLNSTHGWQTTTEECLIMGFGLTYEFSLHRPAMLERYFKFSLLGQ